jgi:TonB family protein
MAHHPTWRPESAKTVQPDDVPNENLPREAAPSDSAGNDNRGEARQESEFARLAAKFVAHGGGKIPAELSGELALDIVLNEIVEQACLATGATGAAIALTRGEEMVCRASSGGNAPELGTRLDMNSGLSGACLRSRLVQCCADALTDPRADAEISRQLGVRSVVVMPLLQDEELIGIFEIFSPRPAAFGERDLRTLEALAGRILRNAQARQSSLVAIGLTPTTFVSQVAEEGVTEESEAIKQRTDSESEAAGEHSAVYESLAAKREPETVHASADAPRFDWLTVTMSGIIVAVALLMGTVFAMRVGWLKVGGKHRSSRTAAVTPSEKLSASAPKQTVGIPDVSAPQSMTPASGQSKSPTELPAFQMEKGRVPEGGLRVYENGKEIFRMPAAPGGIVEVSPDAAEGSLLRRVEPEYPEAARVQRIQGPVLLDVRISGEGAVQEIKVLSGDPVLAQAAVGAVRQWRFKPRTMNGHPVELETKITLKFTLPSN